MLNSWFDQIDSMSEHLHLGSEHEYSQNRIQSTEEFCLRLWNEWTESSPEKVKFIQLGTKHVKYRNQSV